MDRQLLEIAATIITEQYGSTGFLVLDDADHIVKRLLRGGLKSTPAKAYVNHKAREYKLSLPDAKIETVIVTGDFADVDIARVAPLVLLKEANRACRGRLIVVSDDRTQVNLLRRMAKAAGFETDAPYADALNQVSGTSLHFDVFASTYLVEWRREQDRLAREAAAERQAEQERLEAQQDEAAAHRELAAA